MSTRLEGIRSESGRLMDRRRELAIGSWLRLCAKLVLRDQATRERT